MGRPKGEPTRQTNIRIPEDTRALLEAAAARKGRKLSEEIIVRLRNSANEERGIGRDPTTQGLCFLFAELSEKTQMGQPDWRDNLFLFRALKVAINKVMDVLEPKTEMVEPLLFTPLRKLGIANEQDMKSPEAWGEAAANRLLMDFRSGGEPRIAQVFKFGELKPDEDFVKFFLKRMTYQFIGMAKAKRDIGE